MRIRRETPADIDAITRVTMAAFRDHPISQQTEQFIVLALRAANALTISLVAEIAANVVGHVAFSPVTCSDGSEGWYGLGPISVLPEYQRQGIGKALINEGLSLLKELGAQGCALVGNPNYYKKYGFRNSSSLVYEGVPSEVFLIHPFTEKIPQGYLLFHEGFGANS